MNKVLQAAGRVIRTPRDKGVVLLIDNRFAMPDSPPPDAPALETTLKMFMNEQKRSMERETTGGFGNE